MQEAVSRGEKATRTVVLMRETEGILWGRRIDKREKGDQKGFVWSQNAQTHINQVAQPEQKM